MYKPAYIFVLSIIVTLLSGCSVADPAIPIPSYVHIDKINLSTDSVTEGTRSAKITDAWLYVDDQYLGAFQLPATVPVLKEGVNKISVQAGIKINGIAANRGAYSFYSQYTQSWTLKRGEKTNITPTVNYLTGITFSWKEDFETIGVSIIKGPYGSDTTIQKITNTANVFEGSSSGVVYLTGNYFEGISSSAFNLPTNGEAVFLELNYKTNNAFTVGVYANGSSAPIPALTINTSAQWNKIYVDLTTATQFAPSSPYTVFISMSRDVAIAQAELYLDNIKLIRR